MLIFRYRPRAIVYKSEEVEILAQKKCKAIHFIRFSSCARAWPRRSSTLFEISIRGVLLFWSPSARGSLDQNGERVKA